MMKIVIPEDHELHGNKRFVIKQVAGAGYGYPICCYELNCSDKLPANPDEDGLLVYIEGGNDKAYGRLCGAVADLIEGRMKPEEFPEYFLDSNP